MSRRACFSLSIYIYLFFNTRISASHANSRAVSRVAACGLAIICAHQAAFRAKAASRRYIHSRNTHQTDIALHVRCLCRCGDLIKFTSCKCSKHTHTHTRSPNGVPHLEPIQWYSNDHSRVIVGVTRCDDTLVILATYFRSYGNTWLLLCRVTACNVGYCFSGHDCH